jgi:hypothetical protein
MYGAFLVVRDDGSFWDGVGFGPLGAARRFDAGPDAYADCFLAVSCLRKLGVGCRVGYLPRSRKGRTSASRTAPLRR